MNGFLKIAPGFIERVSLRVCTGRFLDKRAEKEERNRLLMAIGWTVLLYIIVFTILAYVA